MNASKYFSLLLWGSMLVFAACTSCTSDSKATAPDVPFKHTDNTVHVRLVAEPDRINPVLTTNAYSRHIYEQIYLPLVGNHPETLAPEPILVKGKPKVSPITEGEFAGGFQFTYELRPEARWADGKPVTVQDVLFTFKAIFNPLVAQTAAYRASFAMLADVQADASNAAVVHFYTKEPHILSEEGFNSQYILPRHIIDPQGLMDGVSMRELIAAAPALEGNANLAAFAQSFALPEFSRSPEKLIGSGPYRMVAWEEGQRITLSRVDNWWGDAFQGKDNTQFDAFPDSLVFKIIPDQAASINALKNEDIDVSFQIDANDFTDLRQNTYVTDRFEMHTPDTYGMFFIGMNTKSPKLNDVKVRRALAHLLDVDFIIENYYAGLATRITGPVLPSRSYYDASLKPIGYNVEQARRLLAEAGWKDSNNNGTVDKMIEGTLTELTLEYLLVPTKVSEAIAASLRENALQAGVGIQVESTDMRTMMGDKVASRNYELYAGGAGGVAPPDDFTQLWHTSSNTPGGSNRVQFGNAESDALIERIRTTMNADERVPMYKAFQKMVYDEQPMIFLFAPKERIAISKRFQATTNSTRPGFQVRRFVHLQQQ